MMPFKNEKQLRVCFTKRLSAKARGKKWTWDCDEWLSKTSWGGNVSSYFEGAKGGIYYYVGKQKLYVPKDAQAYVRKNFQVRKMGGSKERMLINKPEKGYAVVVCSGNVCKIVSSRKRGGCGCKK